MKKIQWLALFFTVIVSISGCAITPATSSLPPSNAIIADGTKYVSEYRHSLQYLQLNNTEKSCYGQIYTALQDYGLSDTRIDDENGRSVPGIRIAITGNQLKQEELSRVYEAVLQDHPQFFYLDRTYSLEGHEANDQRVYDTIILQYTMPLQRRTAADKELAAAVDSILSQCPSTDDYEAERYLHDRLLSLCSYDDEAAAASSQQFIDAYSAYGALVNGKAVCEGYAKAMSLLLHRVNIPATVVLGHSAEDGIAHMWNLVHINGEYYYLDATWNDNDDQPQYAYFNVTTKQLERTHVLSEGSFTPSCTATKDNYYVRNKTFIQSYDRDTIAEAIARRMQAGETAIHLQFDDGKYENGLLFLKNVSLTQKMVNRHLSESTMWDYRLYTYSKQNIITICKE